MFSLLERPVTLFTLYSYIYMYMYIFGILRLKRDYFLNQLQPGEELRCLCGTSWVWFQGIKISIIFPK